MRTKLLGCLLWPICVSGFAHGLLPSRLESESGGRFVAYRFTAINYYNTSDRYEVECFKGADFKITWPCKAIPNQFNLLPHAKRSFKVQIETQGDGIYLVCTKEVASDDQEIITRVCAKWGVGVSVATPGVPTANVHK